MNTMSAWIFVQFPKPVNLWTSWWIISHFKDLKRKNFVKQICTKCIFSVYFWSEITSERMISNHGFKLGKNRRRKREKKQSGIDVFVYSVFYSSIFESNLNKYIEILLLGYGMKFKVRLIFPMLNGYSFERQSLKFVASSIWIKEQAPNHLKEIVNIHDISNVV